MKIRAVDSTKGLVVPFGYGPTSLFPIAFARSKEPSQSDQAHDSRKSPSRRIGCRSDRSGRIPTLRLGDSKRRNERPDRWLKHTFARRRVVVPGVHEWRRFLGRVERHHDRRALLEHVGLGGLGLPTPRERGRRRLELGPLGATEWASR